MIDPKIAAAATKVVAGAVLVAAGTALQSKGMKELGKKFLGKQQPVTVI